MKLVGKTAVGAAIELAMDVKRVAIFTFPASVRVPKLTAYLDGLGSGLGDQVVRGVIYDPSDNRLAQGSEVTIRGDSPAAWVDLPFTDVGGVAIPTAGAYRLGVIAGAANNSGRIYGAATSPLGGKWNADTYADGAAAAFGAATTVTSDLSIFATYTGPWVKPDETDDYYGRLPFELAQSVLGEGAALVTLAGECEWHGTKTDPERGSFCMVRSDGPLAALVGERIRVTSLEAASRSVVAYVHNESAELTEDLSLTRKLYLALSLLSTDSVNVKIEVLE